MPLMLRESLPAVGLRRASRAPKPSGPTVRLLAAAVLLHACCVGAAGLPREVQAALKAAGVPADAVSAVVQEVGGKRPLLSWNAEAPRNPASLFKLVTTTASLDLLGPDFRWSTPVWLDGPVRDGVLEGPLVIQGSGDPTLVFEKVWLLLRRVRELGVRELRDGIVLDRGAFTPGTASPADFDNEPLRPYNVQPDALLMNYGSVVLRFTPSGDQARVSVEPPLEGLKLPAGVPLSDGPCGDWRAALAPSVAAASIDFAGRYPAGCAERTWPVALPEPARYDGRLLAALWQEMGGVMHGSVREGRAPATAPSFAVESPPLAEVVRDINKFSNNVMAMQLFLTLGAKAGAAGSPEAGRAVLAKWLQQHVDERSLGGAVIDNGAGLSRDQRLSAASLAALLQWAYASSVMPELMASLPRAAEDGTLRRMDVPAGCAHLKTGSLKDVAGVAGFVRPGNGRRYVLVGLVNHPQANEARPALDALVRWACRP